MEDKKQNQYFIYFNESEEPIQIGVIQDINRPNCDEDSKVISDYIEYNYGTICYDIYPLFPENKIIL